MPRTMTSRAAWIFACALGIALALPDASHTQTRPPEAQECVDEARTQTDMNQCVAEDFRKADAELNEAYRELMARLDAAAKAELRTAQRAWIAFRDAHCDFEGKAAEGGSLEPFLQGSCAAGLTRERIAHLRNSTRNLP